MTAADPSSDPTLRAVVAGMKYRPTTSSFGLGWPGLVAGDYRAKPDGEADLPALPYHFLLLNLSGAAEVSVRTGGTEHAWRPHPGAITVHPAGTAARWRWRGARDTLVILIETGAVAAIAAAECGLDPGRAALDPLRNHHDARLFAVLTAIRAELSSGGAGGPLCVEALRTVLSVYLIRRQVAGRAGPAPAGRLSAGQLHRVLGFVEDNLAHGLALHDLAATAGLSVYHFARRFKATTGQTPHGYVIARRVERAKLLLGRARTVAEVAAAVGFSDQSHFTRHFKRLVGVTPTQFR